MGDKPAVMLSKFFVGTGKAEYVPSKYTLVFKNVFSAEMSNVLVFTNSTSFAVNYLVPAGAFYRLFNAIGDVFF